MKMISIDDPIKINGMNELILICHDLVVPRIQGVALHSDVDLMFCKDNLRRAQRFSESIEGEM